MSTTPNRRTIRAVALPAEHGGWGFLGEPLLLGLLLAPSVGGGWFALAAAAAFLLHQPLKLTIKDRRKGRRVRRTIWAERFAALYGLIMLAALGMTLLVAPWQALFPIVIALPFGIAQLVWDAQNQSRSLAAEVSGAIALGVTAPVIALIGGWEPGPALLLWGLLVLRAVPSILYVRSRLRLERDKPDAIHTALVAHGAALVLGLVAFVAASAPWTAPAVLAILVVRAAIGLSPKRRRVRAPVIGAMEVGYGVLFVTALTLGYIL
ncbi:MAG: YwiC-like family protein [Anaerolineae bacterium]